MAQETGVDTAEWDAFWTRWSSVLRAIPDAKQRMLEEIGGKLTDVVRRQIAVSGLNDQYGRVQRWQDAHVGSRFGYVAVRSDSVEVAAGGKEREKANAGALTNFLTSGHTIRGPAGRSKRYRPEIHVPRVRGFGFYGAAEGETQQIGLAAAENFMRNLEEQLK